MEKTQEVRKMRGWSGKVAEVGWRWSAKSARLVWGWVAKGGRWRGSVGYEWEVGMRERKKKGHRDIGTSGHRDIGTSLRPLSKAHRDIRSWDGYLEGS